MSSKNIEKKIAELKQLKKKENSVQSYSNKLDYKKYRPKKIKEFVSYEDEVLEDENLIKEKRISKYEKTHDLWIKEKRNLIKVSKEKGNLEEIFKINTLFPYSEIRESQRKLVEDINNAINQQKIIITHAPTGLGKTIASLGPAIEYAIRAKKTVFFLTSRHTQHAMAIKTIQDIKKKFNIEIDCLDIIGKKKMCSQKGIESIGGPDFSEYCKNAKKERTCEYYNKTRKADGLPKIEAEIFLEQLENSVLHTNKFMSLCEKESFCSYEAALIKAETSQVIITDYSYVFHPRIREIFFKKIGVDLKDSIIVIDEAHNLPERTKDIASDMLNSNMIIRSLKEAEKHNQRDAYLILNQIKKGFDNIKPDIPKNSIDNSGKISKEEFNSILSEDTSIEIICSVLESAVYEIRKKQKRCSMAGILNFIVSWQGSEEGFSRIFSIDKDRNSKVLKYCCLDPAIVTKKVFEECESAVAISGTLQPMFMYKDLFGINEAELKSYENPFPKENALHLIVPKTTTKYDKRSLQEFEKISEECKKIISLVKGNTAFFFSSYSMRDKIYRHLYGLDEEFLLEEPNLNSNEKEKLYKDFINSTFKRKIFLGASSGSFGEGVDFPGHFLTCVVVVGLPLMKPTLEVNELIRYYNEKFGKGWDYGYFYPSFNRTFQNVGRCIRSETDKGIMIYLDERFSESRYLKYFQGRDYEICIDYEEKIKKFNHSD